MMKKRKKKVWSHCSIVGELYTVFSMRGGSREVARYRKGVDFISSVTKAEEDKLFRQKKNIATHVHKSST